MDNRWVLPAAEEGSMKRLKSHNGSISVEFLLSFAYISVALVLFMEFVVLSISGDLTTYATYMGSRALKVNEFADVRKVVKAVAPWVADENISYGSNESYRWVRVSGRPPLIASEATSFSLINRNWKQNIGTAMIFDPALRMGCEDNPLWFVAGGEPCP